jgi:2-polyprenyl-6-methoxyphenol hydroxylase-like FAD-dependent oxidoreductase
MQRIGEHAAVIGASVGGLLAARVLADAFERVTVIDRDRLPEPGEPRRAVPQGRHAHALLPAGQDALEQLLPGFMADAVRAGAPTYEFGANFRFSAAGHRIRRVETGRRALVASRPLIEGLVRRRVEQLGNVDIEDQTDALGLVATGSRVTGLRVLRRTPGSAEETVASDLVVAASGRGGRLPAWMEALGFERPEEERVAVDILYRSCRLRLPEGALGRDKLILVGPQPGVTRGMALFAQEGGQWLLTLYGYGDADHPPADRRGYLEFAATVADPDVLAALREADWLGEIAAHRFPASLRRHYERLRRFPSGLLVIGDAISSFNPIYGQGMTVASLEALALRRCLQRGDRKLARRFFRAAARAVDHAWNVSVGADLALPEVVDRPPARVALVNASVDRVQATAEHDEAVARAFVEVTGMLRPPTHVMRPRIAARVLAARKISVAPTMRAGRSAPEAAQLRTNHTTTKA